MSKSNTTADRELTPPELHVGLQSYFDELLLAKLIERGVITKADAEEIATKTVVFAHELADLRPKWTQSILLAAQSFERMIRAFGRRKQG